MKFLIALFVVLGAGAAQAADIFIADTVVQTGATEDEAESVHQLVQNAVHTAGMDTVVEDEMRADFVLQPRIMKLGESYILTVERRKGDEILYASQVKANSINDLDRAARRATLAALSDPTLRGQDSSIAADEGRDDLHDDSQSATTAQEDAAAARGPAEAYSVARPGYQLNPGLKTDHYWSIGAGPFFARRMDTDDVFYNLSLGHIWDIHPRASAKVIGEANISTGDSDAHFYNAAIGASWFFAPSGDGSAYLTGDLGYGFAQASDDEDTDGFTFGTGLGYQFFRTSRTTMDVLLRYAALTNDIDEGEIPQMLGVRLAVNF